ncbi:cytochrome P450 [Acephala macrosclerotiorum]|nr:cytochrome P450 [Acephala macrosclerotiorum]
MIDDIIETGTAIIQWDRRATVIASVFIIFIVTQFITSLRSIIALRAKGDGKTPPIEPYSIPILGNLISFAFNTEGFLGKIIKTYGPNVPVRIRILNRKIHFISGSESVLTLFRSSRNLTTVPAAILVLEGAFGSPASARPTYERDNTGIFKEPLPGSNNLEPHNRIFHNSHKGLHKNLQGNALIDLADRFLKNLEAELSSLSIGYEWTDVPDLYRIIKETVFKASTEAICGPHLFRLNSDFVADFWEFDTQLPQLFKSLPRWLIPKSFRNRDNLTACIMRWHKFAREHIDPSDPDLEYVEWEEYFGARVMRERQKELSQIDGFTDKALAATDLGMIWGSNANIVPIIGWEILDVLFRPNVLAQARGAIQQCSDHTKTGVAALEMPKLVANPLLQSIYSEELRIRNGVIIQRAPISEGFKIGRWLFPKDDLITVSSWHEHRDRSVWNEGPVNGEFHSVEDFWAERFIVYPNDPNSGPRKPSPNSKLKKTEKTADNKLRFTADAMTGSFFPYGGGQTICPGRFYAKQEAIGALAMFLTMFDIELMDKEKMPQPNLDYFPFGVVPPDRKVPARMRRRRLE